MKSYSKRQMEILKRVNDNFNLIALERDWIEIAKTFCENETNDSGSTYKMSLLLERINEYNLKAYNYAENLLYELSLLL